MALVLLLSTFTALLPAVLAQATNAVCQKGFDWMTNSLGQNPCMVTAWLSTPCYGTGNDTYVESIQPGWTYTGPTDTSQYDSTPCDCNTVLYSTYAACGICQGAGIDPWPIYKTYCVNVYNGTFPEPIPGGTAVPAWAFLDILANSTFNAAAAKELADTKPPDVRTISTTASATPESPSSSKSLATAIVSTTTSLSPSTTASSNTTTSSSTNGTSSATAAGAAATATHTDVGPIVGASFGGLVGVLLAGALILFIVLRHRRRIANSANMTTSDSSFGVASNAVSDYAFSPTKMGGPVLHDSTSDMRTFPHAPSVGQFPSTRRNGNGGLGGLGRNLTASMYRGFPQM